MKLRDSFLLIGIFFLAAAAIAQNRAATPTSDTVAIIRITGQVEESIDPLAIFGPETESLRILTSRIDGAAQDPRVTGLIVQLQDPVMGAAQAAELHNALLEFKASGKTLITMFDEADIWDYLVASAGDYVVMSPVGSVDIYGMAAHLYFFQPLLAKIGMSAQVVATGDYKTALEPFLRPDMSEGTRIQVTELIETYSRYLVDSVASNRGLEPEAARRSLWGGPYSSKGALEAGLVTDVAYFTDFKDEFAQSNGIRYAEDYRKDKGDAAEAPNLFSLFSGLSGEKRRSATRGSRIAVIYAVGPIILGRAERNPFSFDQVIASDDFIDLIDEAIAAGDTRAIVLRVDSPGGSAIASDRIWNHLERVQADGIPVVVSMGNVAASGGYYISMGADRILVEPTTITGSIGVIGGRLVVGGTYSKLGVNKQMITVGPHAGIVDETRPWNDTEVAVIRAIIEDMYHEFVSKAAEGRGMEYETLESLARGRVWSGLAAIDKGLADEVGGLDRAVEVARELANVPNASVVVYPEEMSFIEYLNRSLSGDISMTAPKLHAGAFDPSAAALAELLPGKQVEVFQTTLRLLQAGEPYSVLMYEPAAWGVE